MTLQEAKDHIAKKYSVDLYNLTVWMSDEAAELYARSKWDEACERQRKICYEIYMNAPVSTGANKFEAIRNEMLAIEKAPKPEFKP